MIPYSSFSPGSSFQNPQPFSPPLSFLFFFSFHPPFPSSSSLNFPFLKYQKTKEKKNRKREKLTRGARLGYGDQEAPGHAIGADHCCPDTRSPDSPPTA